MHTLRNYVIKGIKPTFKKHLKLIVSHYKILKFPLFPTLPLACRLLVLTDLYQLHIRCELFFIMKYQINILI